MSGYSKVINNMFDFYNLIFGLEIKKQMSFKMSIIYLTYFVHEFFNVSIFWTIKSICIGICKCSTRIQRSGTWEIKKRHST